MACEFEQLPPDDTPEDTEPPPYDGPQRVELAEALSLGPLTHGRRDERAGRHADPTRQQSFQVPEDGDDPPAPPLADHVRARAELAALDTEFDAIIRVVIDRIAARGVTREQLEIARGDVDAERALLGMTAAEYTEILDQLVRLDSRGRRLLEVVRPLMRDDYGNDWICTTDRTVEELDDGTIVITDHDSCEPVYDGGGSPGGQGPGDGPDGQGGGWDGPPISKFEIACNHAAGTVVDGRCSCDQSSLCRYAAWATGYSIFYCYSPMSCIPTIAGFAATIFACRELRCDKVNKDYGK